MGHRFDLATAAVRVRGRRLTTHQRLARNRVLSLRQTMEVFVVNIADEPPAASELPVPLAWQ